MTNVVDREPNLVSPWAPHRVRMYVATALFTGLVFVGGMTIGVGIGIIEPDFTSDVVANLLFGIPAILIPPSFSCGMRPARFVCGRRRPPS